MKYLVTGGAGFIGANIVKHLLQAGFEVVVLDNYAGGKFPERFQKGATYIEGDIRNEKDLDRAAVGADGIFHLAALPRVTYSIEHPLETHDTNVNGTLQVLLAARRNKVKRVVFSSSSSVYGNLEKYPATEDMPSRPISFYATHKMIGENYCRLFSELYGVETVCLRYFNVYGPYFDPDGPYALVVGKFLKQVKNGQPMTVCGDGNYYRDFGHARDVARANLLAMQSAKVGAGEIINIANGEPFHLLKIAELIGGKNYVFVPERPGDVRRTEADNSKAKKLLDWEPTVSFEQGVEELKQEWGIGSVSLKS